MVEIAPTATYITECFVHFEDFIGNLGARDHGSLSHFLEDRFAEEDKLLVLLVAIVVVTLLVGVRRRLTGPTGCFP